MCCEAILHSTQSLDEQQALRISVYSLVLLCMFVEMSHVACLKEVSCLELIALGCFLTQAERDLVEGGIDNC